MEKNYKLYDRSHQTDSGTLRFQKRSCRRYPRLPRLISVSQIPNEEPVLNTAEVHTIEHLAATFLRNHAEYGPKTLYFGPMGCRTGFYLLLIGDYESCDILPFDERDVCFYRILDQEVPRSLCKRLRKLFWI